MFVLFLAVIAFAAVRRRIEEACRSQPLFAGMEP